MNRKMYTPKRYEKIEIPKEPDHYLEDESLGNSRLEGSFVEHIHR